MDLKYTCTHICVHTDNTIYFDLIFSIPDLGQSTSESVTECHFRILTQRVTFETWDPSHIWSAWCLDKKTKRQKKTLRQKNKKTNSKKTKRQKDKKKKRQKDKRKDQKRSLMLCVRAVSHSCNVLDHTPYEWQVFKSKLPHDLAYVNFPLSAFLDTFQHMFAHSNMCLQRDML